MQSGVLGTGFLLSGGLSCLAAGSEPSSSSESGPPYGLEGFPSYKEYKAAKRAAREELHPRRVDPDNPSILFHDYLCRTGSTIRSWDAEAAEGSSSAIPGA